MEALCDLLFEFSNEERLKILLELEKGPKNLTRIAKDLDFTSQGTSRNVARLVETSLIRRNPDGEYELTPYGGVALRLLSSYDSSRGTGSISWVTMPPFCHISSSIGWASSA
jgi:predicted transcriptional regulator